MTTEDRPLVRALALWRQINGIAPDADMSNDFGTHTVGSWEVRKTFKAIKEALDLDPTEITATLLLTHFVKEHAASHSFSLDALLHKPAEVEATLAPVREALRILHAPTLIETRDAFIEAIRAALVQYDAAGREDIQKLLAKPDEIAILRRDALRSIANLRVDQFLDGSPEPAGVRPVYTKTVHQWWNVNSMLAAVTRQPAGVSLNLIRHPDGFQSYFAFVIRNGGNVFVLSDTPDYAHPLQGYMSRRPDRALDERAARNWFPYDLLGLEYDEESDRLYFAESKARGLVAYQNAALPLKPVSELPPRELVWLAMMFDLIVERFWKQGWKAPALSYTAEMLVEGNRLLAHAAQARLPVAGYEPVGLQPLTVADMHHETVDEAAVGRKYENPNAWMEARYASRVTPEALNLIAPPETTLAITDQTGAVGEVEIPRNAHEWDARALMEGKTKLHALDATTFGTREKLHADRLFLARHNYARRITQLAVEEFEQRKDEVLAWWHKRLEANRDTLLAYAGNAIVWVDAGMTAQTFGGYGDKAGRARSVEPRRPDESMFDDRPRPVLLHAVLERHVIKEVRFGLWGIGGKVLSEMRDRHPLCAVNGAKATYAVGFTPATPQELAVLAACKVDELPDVLQHWDQLRPYHGNSILSRIDPMVWVAQNPWRKLDLRFILPLSVRGLAAVQKVAALPPLPGATTETPTR
jgi:hypothetical protein